MGKGRKGPWTLTVTPTVTASSAYTAGDCVGGELGLTLPSELKNLDRGIIEAVTIIDESANETGYEAYFITEALGGNSSLVDHAAITHHADDASKLINGIAITDHKTPGTGIGISQARNIEAPFNVAAGKTTLMMYLKTTDTPTFASTSDLIIHVKVSGID